MRDIYIYAYLIYIYISYAYIHMYIYKYMYMCICMCICTCINMYISTCIVGSTGSCHENEPSLSSASSSFIAEHWNTLQTIATHCTTHCKPRQHTDCNTLQHTTVSDGEKAATRTSHHCSPWIPHSPRRTYLTRCNTLQHTETDYTTLRHIETHGNMHTTSRSSACKCVHARPLTTSPDKYPDPPTHKHRLQVDQMRYLGGFLNSFWQPTPQRIFGLCSTSPITYIY